MKKYLHQLLEDIERIIEKRWAQNPPHSYQMGVPEMFVDPPASWDGPPFGYANPDFQTAEEFFSDLEEMDILANPLPVDERVATDHFVEEDDLPLPDGNMEGGYDPEFEKNIAEIERFVHEQPVKNMFYHFGLSLEEFPPADQLTDEELDVLVVKTLRLWAAYNFIFTFPERVPKRMLYPLLLKRMSEPAFVMERGMMGIEFCEYEPSGCPFGAEWCTCKDHIETQKSDL